MFLVFKKHGDIRLDIFLDNILVGLKKYAIDYKYDPFIEMAYTLIDKEKCPVQTRDFKYLDATKETPRKTYYKKEEKQVNVVDIVENKQIDWATYRFLVVPKKML